MSSTDTRFSRELGSPAQRNQKAHSVKGLAMWCAGDLLTPSTLLWKHLR
jgi:hypothetical protein